MIVYRVENENGQGPWYNSKFDCFDLGWDYGEIYPGPQSDELINKSNDELEKILNDKILFGCQTIELIIHWFENASQLLTEHNYDIVKYEISDEHVIIGQYQCVFAKSKAKKLN